MTRGIITADVDDNKFVDCAIAANARFIVSEDAHFNAVRRIDFPALVVLRLAEFARLL
ncbi:PIN domain-containing protein [Palleniella muris]|uniref:PIN domain-containing protein n=1 Tax=Palleniella muris TaxID=3038145 RepID=UPI0030CA4524